VPLETSGANMCARGVDIALGRFSKYSVSQPSQGEISVQDDRRHIEEIEEIMRHIYATSFMEKEVRRIEKDAGEAKKKRKDRKGEKKFSDLSSNDDSNSKQDLGMESAVDFDSSMSNITRESGATKSTATSIMKNSIMNRTTINASHGARARKRGKGPVIYSLHAKMLSAKELGNLIKLFAERINQGGVFPIAVKTMNLAHNLIDGECMEQLLEGIVCKEINSSLTHLCLDGNPIGPAGADAFSAFVRKRRQWTLTNISLRFCELGPEGGKNVAKWLARAKGVVELNLEMNGFDEAALQALYDTMTSKKLKGKTTITISEPNFPAWSGPGGKFALVNDDAGGAKKGPSTTRKAQRA